MNIINNIDKLRATVLYITNKTGRIGFHKLFKILYFADMRHLADYGRVVAVNDYVAMERGPVPSYLYNILTYMRYGNSNWDTEPFENSLNVNEYRVSATEEPDLEELSISDIECLDYAIEKILPLNMTATTQVSHGPAYMKAWTATTKKSHPIDIYDIAVEGGATEDLIDEMREADILYTKLA